MFLQKLIALVIGVLVILFIFPHAKRGEFIAPSPIAPNTWMADYVESDYAQALATPPEGYGMRRIDFWNNPPQTSRTITDDDVRIKLR